MSEWTIELGPELVQLRCDCCGRPYRTGRGFVYRGLDAYATYSVSLHQRHPERHAVLMVTLGNDSEEAAWEPGVSFLMMAWSDTDGICYGLQDPDQSPWELESDLYGQVLTKEEAKAHPSLKEVWDIVDFVSGADPALGEHLGKTNRANRPHAPKRGRRRPHQRHRPST